MRHVIPVSGKDSLCTALVQTALHPDLAYEFVFSDVGMELPETYAWLDHVEAALGQAWGRPVEVVRVGRSMTEMIERWDLIPSARRRYCTAKGKIKPMEDLLAGTADDPVTVYYGLRADEGHRRGPITGEGVTAAFPLQRLGFGVRDVWAHLGRESDRLGVDLLPPPYDWPALREAVALRVAPLEGAEDPTAGLEPWMERELFAGRSRSNCYLCFFQRLYEWAWLLDTHPDLYAEAERLETETGRTRQQAFTWNPSWSLAALRGERDRLVASRADDVARRIGALRQRRLFTADDTPPELARVSCGLLCGK